MSILRIKSFSHLSPELQARNGSPVLAKQAAIAAPGISSPVAGLQTDSASGGDEATVRGKQVMLPWPPSILSPNARPHWSAKSRAAKQYRNACYLLAHEAGMRGVEWEGTIHLWITYLPPDRRHRDDDNLIAAFKSGRDGLADAMGVDDKRFRIHPYVSTSEYVKGGAVRIVLTPGAEAHLL